LSVAFSPDGRSLASSSTNGTIILWDTTSGTRLKTLAGDTDLVLSVAFSPDGRSLASSSTNGTIILWDTANWTKLKTLAPHGKGVWSVSFSPDGRTLASGSDDRTVVLWDIASGAKLKTFTGHTDYVMGVAFSPDGRTLASGSSDKSIILWDLASATQLQTLTGHTDWVQSIAFSPDGRTLASGSTDGTIRLWKLYNLLPGISPTPEATPTNLPPNPPPTSVPTASNNQNPVTYTNEEFGMSFPVPDGLSLYTPGNPGPIPSLFTQGQLLYLVNPDFTDENIGASYITGVTDADLKQFKDLLDTNPPTATQPGYKKISVRFINIGTKGDTLAVEHVYNMQGNVYGTIRQVTFIHNGRGFTFTCATAQSRYEEANKNFFDPIFANMEFK
jgi:WD40 repeat protein